MTMTRERWEEIILAIILLGLILSVLAVSGCSGVDVVGPENMGDGSTFAPETDNVQNSPWPYVVIVLGMIILYMAWEFVKYKFLKPRGLF